MRPLTILLSCALLWIMSTACVFAADADDFHRLYAELLETYWHAPVTINGIRTTVFDYARMAADAGRADSPFDRTRAALERVEPKGLDPDEAKAFWINAYNFGAMRLVVEHYPVESIRSFKISLLKYPWSQTAVTVNGRGHSLKEIEKDILLARFGDPRIVFAVSCAAVSCPDRVPEPFTAGRLDEQLDEMIRAFFANPGKGAALDRESGVLRLSWILDKDAELFRRGGEGVLDFVIRYLPVDDRRWLHDHAVEVQYLDHDWTLNDLAQADSTSMQ